MEQLVPSMTHDKGETIQSDLTGFHKIAVVQSCREKQCHKRLCNTEHEAVCPHKAGDNALVAALGGILTHKIPPNKEGVLLDNFDGDANPQYMVVEKTIIPLEMKSFKENEKMTDYVQQPTIAEKIRGNLPSKSLLDLKKTSINDAPLDENL